jgi:hypothetical protein
MGAKEIKDTRKDLKLTMARYGPLLQAAKVTDLVYMCVFPPLGLSDPTPKWIPCLARGTTRIQQLTERFGGILAREPCPSPHTSIPTRLRTTKFFFMGSSGFREVREWFGGVGRLCTAAARLENLTRVALYPVSLPLFVFLYAHLSPSA